MLCCVVLRRPLCLIRREGGRSPDPPVTVIHLVCAGFIIILPRCDDLKNHQGSKKEKEKRTGICSDMRVRSMCPSITTRTSLCNHPQFLLKEMLSVSTFQIKVLHIEV